MDRLRDEQPVEFGLPLLSRTSVVLRDPQGLSLADQAHVVAVAARTLGGRLADFPEIAAAVPMTNIAGLVPSASERGTTAVVYLFFFPDTSGGDRAAVAQEYAHAFFQAPTGGTLSITGPFAALQVQGLLIGQALPLVEVGSLLVVVLVVGLRFRSVVAPVVALLAAGGSYLVSMHVIGWLGQRFGIGVAGTLEPLLVVLLIGVVTDYAVFLLSGYQQQLRGGRSPREAMCRAGGDVIPLVVMAGVAVAAGTASLLVARLGLFRQLGPGMAVTVLVTMVVAVTFISALLAVLGRVALWPSRLARHPEESRAAPPPQQRHGLWVALLRRVVRPPVAAVLLAVGVAVLAAGRSRWCISGWGPTSSRICRARPDRRVPSTPPPVSPPAS